MALIRCPNCGRIALGYKVAAEDAVAVTYTMGRVMPDVRLCAVILLLANGISSSTSLRIQSRQSDHFKGSQETTAAVKTCEEIKDTCKDATGCTCKDQAGQIALLANKIVVRFRITKNAARHRRDTAEQNCTADLTELVKMIKAKVPDVVEDSIKCTGDDVQFEVFAEKNEEATNSADLLSNCGQPGNPPCPLKKVSFSDTQKKSLEEPKSCQEKEQECEKENKKCEIQLGKPVCVDPVPHAVAPGKERIQEGCSCNCNCPLCAMVESSANDVVVKNVSLKEQGPTPQTAAVYEKLGALMPLKERVDSLLQVKGMVTALQASLQHISEKHDKIIYHLGSIDNEVASLKLLIARVEMSGMNRKISELQKQLSDYNEHLTKQTLMIN